ncbi:hypothetical protein [Flavobacterium aestivum]|uniref:hypothetical protein n=1 Tax=Flavobacterium aestivum TaxID=3003257 RepID=UPI00248316B4|nr:hypothetical protein [Flavobacterium aestivum]
MNEKVFKTDFIKFTDRIKNDMFFCILIILGIIIYWFCASEEDYGELIGLVFFIIAALLYTIENYINSINFISEIRIDKEKITLIGYEFNSKWEEKIDIKRTEIKIKSKGGKSNIQYLLRLSCDKEVYDINKLFNWDYFTIVEIYKEFKKNKEEKIILDEKFILDNVLNKAKGLSPLDVLFNRTK